MLELLRDPVWQFAGVVAAIFAIGVAVAIYLAQRVRKGLAYEVLRNGRVLSEVEQALGELKLLFENQPVNDARLIEMRMTNSGNQPITVADFVEPLTISFNEGALVLSAVTIRAQPEYLNAELAMDSNAARLTPLLLNPRDELVIKLLVAQYESGPHVRARIAGVKDVTSISEGRLYEGLLILGGMACMIGAAIVAPKAPEAPPVPWAEKAPWMILLAVSMASMVMAYVAMLRRLVRRTRGKKLLTLLRDNAMKNLGLRTGNR